MRLLAIVVGIILIILSVIGLQGTSCQRGDRRYHAVIAAT